jgi:hypothetical protein
MRPLRKLSIVCCRVPSLTTQWGIGAAAMRSRGLGSIRPASPDHRGHGLLKPHRGRAGVVAYGECHRRRAFYLTEVRIGGRIEGVRLSPGVGDLCVDGQAADQPEERVGPRRCQREGAGRDGDRENADLERDRLGGREDAVARAPQGQTGVQCELGPERGDRQLGGKGTEWDNAHWNGEETRDLGRRVKIHVRVLT